MYIPLKPVLPFSASFMACDIVSVCTLPVLLSAFLGVASMANTAVFILSNCPSSFFFDTLFTHTRASSRALSSSIPLPVFLKNSGITVVNRAESTLGVSPVCVAISFIFTPLPRKNFILS